MRPPAASLALCLALSAPPAAALDLVGTGRHALNRPATLDDDPTSCGLWIANAGPEAARVPRQVIA